MKVFYSDTQRLHNPPFEVFDGGQRVPYLENPDRLDKILSALSKTDWADITQPSDFGLDPIIAIHDPAYINFLASAWDEWTADHPGQKYTSENPVLLPATFALRRHPQLPTGLLGRAGYYIMDLSAGIVAGTYTAARASANSALSGAKFLLNNSDMRLSPSGQPNSVFALCRPPGHHAGRDYAAGYCYINNAAVSANWLSAHGKVTILDIDYHACNGTQDIFYARSDVLTISLHGDPNFEYPYYAGYSVESGVGSGKNFHRNFPLPAGTGNAEYLTALDEAINIILDFAPKYLVVSLGTDIYESDPLGRFKITTSGFHEIGNKIANIGIQTLIVMEGGYNNDALGENILSFLTALL